jgi:dienelactone hydrolase
MAPIVLDEAARHLYPRVDLWLYAGVEAGIVAQRGGLMTYRLSDLHRDGPPPLPEAAGWPARRAEIEAVWRSVTGPLVDPAPVSYEVLETVEHATHTSRRIRYATGDGDGVPALLLTPHAAGVASPAVLALHPTSPNGKDDIATRDGRENRRYGLELAERGYVVLAPDTITAGDRIEPGEKPFHTARRDAAHPELSAVGKMVSDHRQGVELLCSLPEVDPARIGVIGHSLGGYNAFFLAGADLRIAATVSSCGFATFAGDSQTHRWGRRDWFSHLPALSPMIEADHVPFEMHEIAALVAPRPFFNWMAAGDHIFPHWRPAVAAMEQVAQLYQGLGHEGDFMSLLGTGDHDFPAPVRAAAYAFFDQHLAP